MVAPRVLGLVLGIAIGCAPPPPVDTDTAPLTGPVWRCQTAPPMPLLGSSCSALPAYQYRLTYDLSATELTTLAWQLSAPSGLTVARLQGCELEILTDCHAVGRYASTTNVRDLQPRQELSTPEELWSNLPRFAASEGGPAVDLRPLAGHPHSTHRCIPPTVQRSGFCVDDKEHPPGPCIDPALPRCGPNHGRLTFPHAPDTLDASELWSSLSAAACEGYYGKYELTIDGPTGRVIEVCGAGREFEAAVARIFATALPTTRQPGQRHSLSCMRRTSSTAPGE
jgi:hypothetical protein